MELDTENFRQDHIQKLISRFSEKPAKKQIALGGHPDTTGLNTVDYFIGNKLNQPSNAQNYYTEKLVLFNNTVLK